MKFARSLAVISTMTFSLLCGLPAAHAGVESWAGVTLSNVSPSVGDPVAIYVELTNCTAAPTTFQVALYSGPMMAPFATLTKSTSGYTMRKSGSTIYMQWIYRGPTGDGITSDAVFTVFTGSGGCAPNNEGFESVNSWAPTNATNAPSDVWGIYPRPQHNAIQLSWSAPYAGLDPSLYYEIQYSIFGLNTWSRSFATRDTSYVILGLTYQTIYDVRIRAVNRFGAGPWTQDTHQNYQRTPALFTTWLTDVNGIETTNPSLPAGNVMHARLSNCDYSPTPSNTGGTLSWYIFPTSSADNGTTFEGVVEISPGATTSYDQATKTYDASFTMPDLPAGNYQAFMFFYGMGCSWNFTPNALDGSKSSNTLEFSVGDHVVRKPLWGSRIAQGDWVTVSNVSATSATLSWGTPQNIEDGPFTYSVSLLDDNGGVAKTLGTTTSTSFTMKNLQQFTRYSMVVRASNSATTTTDSEPYMYMSLQTATYTAKRGAKLNATTLSAATGIKIPSGATVALTKPAGTSLFTNCTFKSNIVTLANSIGACSIKMTIKPKKVGRTQPASIIKTFDVMVRR